MRFTLSLLAVLASVSIASAQAFNNPESCEWDPVNNGWLVSNTGTGQIVSTTSDGTITSQFAIMSGTGPHGLEVLHDTVYACNGSRIRGFDLHTGTEVFNENLGAGFLNGLTSDGDRFLFATDFSMQRIYRIDVQTGAYNQIVTNPQATPNGIHYDGPNNRLVYVAWGNGADIRAVDLADSTVSTLATTSLGNMDGITQDDNGNWYVSTWSPAGLSQFSNDWATGPTTVLSGLTNPADIDFSSTTDSLAIPNSGNSTLSFYHSADTVPDTNTAVLSVALPMNGVRLFPVPATDQVQLSFMVPLQSEATANVVDASGRLVATERLALGTVAHQLNVQHLTAGTYFVVLNGDGLGQERIPLVVK